MSDRAYGLVRSLVEQLGGSMIYERKGSPHGAWKISIGENSREIKVEGSHSFPELDQLYIPKVENPQNWNGYKNELVPDAKTRLFLLFHPLSHPEYEVETLEELIGRAKWKFAWTYARTYPHEYTTKAKCNPEDHAKLIDCIEKYGVVEPFGEYKNKYFYFEDRKYWHMGNPYSQNPEDWPNVINRTWVDVSGHAANVSHCWTDEEVELQIRIWEIQIEKKLAKKAIAKSN
jgi:hypothetical protein